MQCVTIFNYCYVMLSRKYYIHRERQSTSLNVFLETACFEYQKRTKVRERETRTKLPLEKSFISVFLTALQLFCSMICYRFDDISIFSIQSRTFPKRLEEGPLNGILFVVLLVNGKLFRYFFNCYFWWHIKIIVIIWTTSFARFIIKYTIF